MADRVRSSRRFLDLRHSHFARLARVEAQPGAVAPVAPLEVVRKAVPPRVKSPNEKPFLIFPST